MFYYLNLNFIFRNIRNKGFYKPYEANYYTDRSTLIARRTYSSNLNCIIPKSTTTKQNYRSLASSNSNSMNFNSLYKNNTKNNGLNERSLSTNNLKSLLHRKIEYNADSNKKLNFKPEFKVDRRSFYTSRDKHDIHSGGNYTSKVNSGGGALFFNYN